LHYIGFWATRGDFSPTILETSTPFSSRTTTGSAPDLKSTRLISTCPLAIRCPTLIYRLVGSFGAFTITSMSLPTLTTPLTSTPLALSVEGGGGGGAGGGGGLGSCHDGGGVNSGSLGRPGNSLVAMLGMLGGRGGAGGRAAIAGGRPGVAPGRPGVAAGRRVPWGLAVVPLGKPGIEGTPGIDDAGAPAISGEPAGLDPGRPGLVPVPPVVPVGNPGIEGTPGIAAGFPATFGAPAGLAPGRPGTDAGFPATFGEPPGLAPGRPGAAWGRAEIGGRHWGRGVSGRLGRLDTCAGL
jgi:hypothetical protein